MKTLLLLLAAFCMVSFSYGQSWKATGVGSPGKEIFYNAENITILNIGQHKNVVETWCKEKFFNQLIEGNVYSSGYVLTLYAFDCNENVWSVNEIIFNRPSGKVIRDYTYDAEWKGVPPGSPIALLFYTICHKYSDK